MLTKDSQPATVKADISCMQASKILYVLWEILRGKYPIILRMREQWLSFPKKRRVKEASFLLESNMHFVCARTVAQN